MISCHARVMADVRNIVHKYYSGIGVVPDMYFGINWLLILIFWGADQLL